MKQYAQRPMFIQSMLLLPHIIKWKKETFDKKLSVSLTGVENKGEVICEKTETLFIPIVYGSLVWSCLALIEEHPWIKY